jgi:hypothetical protein
VRRILSWLAWWGLLFGLWLALVGVWGDPYERIAGYCAAALGATAAEIARAQGVLSFRIEPRWALRLWRPLVRVPSEFALVLGTLGRQLPRPRRRVGAFRAAALPAAAGDDPAATGRRVLVCLGGTLPPNTLVLDADERTGELLIHELVARGPSEPL